MPHLNKSCMAHTAPAIFDEFYHGRDSALAALAMRRAASPWRRRQRSCARAARQRLVTRLRGESSRIAHNDRPGHTASLRSRVLREFVTRVV